MKKLMASLLLLGCRTPTAFNCPTLTSTKPDVWRCGVTDEEKVALKAKDLIQAKRAEWGALANDREICLAIIENEGVLTTTKPHLGGTRACSISFPPDFDPTTLKGIVHSHARWDAG